MKKIINTLALLLILHAAPILAQDSSTADAAAGACINGSQWFRLYDIYEKDSASMSPMIRRFSKAMLATAFNRNEEAAEAITTLVRNHQQEMGAMLCRCCRSSAQPTPVSATTPRQARR